MLNPDRAKEGLQLVAERVPFPIAGSRILELGCGVGTFQLVAQQAGAWSAGIEPSFLGASAANCQMSERRAEPGAICCSVGEYLPFDSGTFDIVCSFQVLEHVRDPKLVFDESLRVLRDGGYLVHVFPNFGSLWEGHYGILWPPHLPKSLGRLYLKALGRPLDMLEELQLLSHQSVERLLEERDDITIIDWGVSLWERRVRDMQFSEWAYLNRLKLMLTWAHRLRLIDSIVGIGKAVHWETPIILVVRKNGGRRSNGDS
jgi:SAM-dependent methyltransferase